MLGGYHVAKATICNPFLALGVLLGGIRCLIEEFTLFRFFFQYVSILGFYIWFCKWHLVLILFPHSLSFTLFSHPCLYLILLLSPFVCP